MKQSASPFENKGQTLELSRLVRDHHRAMLALAVPIVGQSDADEVVQNAWIKAWKGLDRFEGRSSPRTWLSRIVINEARMHLRRQRRQALFADCRRDQETDDALADRFLEDGHWRDPPATWDLDAPDALLMGEQLAECLERLLDRMPPSQRALLEMRDAGGLSFEQICNELAISASNARVLLHRARGQLFKLVDHYEETGEC